MPLDQVVNAEARNRMAAAIEEDMLAGWAVGDESVEFSNSPWPQRTKALFAAFATDLHGGSAQVQIWREVIEPAVGLKLKSLHEGADIASTRLWGRQATS